MASKKKKTTNDETSSDKPITESGMTLTRVLPVKLTDSEVAMKARYREEVEAKKVEIESEKKKAVDEFNDRLAELDEEIDALREIVKTGIDRRPVACIGERDHEHGRIVFIRPDTREVVDWRPMSSTEKQLAVGDVTRLPPPLIVNAVCDGCGIATPSGQVAQHHPSCPKLKPISAPTEAPPPAPAAEPSPTPADRELPPEEPVSEDESEELEEEDEEPESMTGKQIAEALEEEDDELPPPPADEEEPREERSKLSPNIGYEVADAGGGTHAVSQTIADALRAANRVGRPIYIEGGIELSHIKGEPVRVEVEGGRVFDLVPSEVVGLRRAIALGKQGELQIVRRGRPWRYLKIATPVEERDDGGAALEQLGGDVPPPSSEEPAPDEKKGAKPSPKASSSKKPAATKKGGKK